MAYSHLDNTINYMIVKHFNVVMVVFIIRVIRVIRGLLLSLSWLSSILSERQAGLEPVTCGLGSRCSTN